MSSPLTYARLATSAMPDIMESGQYITTGYGSPNSSIGTGQSMSTRIAFVTDTRELLLGHSHGASDRGSVDGCSEADTPIEMPCTNGHQRVNNCDSDLTVSVSACSLYQRVNLCFFLLLWQIDYSYSTASAVCHKL